MPASIRLGVLLLAAFGRVLPDQAISVSVRAAGCLPFVIDGQLFPDGSAMQDVVVPEVIDYMVVLRGSEVGVRYGSIGHNGIILIATKRDWRRLPR
jgi:hypothetical protein